MKAQPIIVALGFVCAFAAGWAAGTFNQTQAPTPPSNGLARAVVNGNVIEYAPGSDVEIETFDNHRSDEGAESLSRQTDAASGALSTTSAEVASSYEQTAPTDGIGGSGGGIVSQIKAASGNPMNVLYLIGGASIVAGGVVGLGVKRPALGLGLAAGGLGVILIAWFAAEQPDTLWLLGVIGIVGVGWWVWTAVDAERKRRALEAVTGAVESAKKINPEAASLVKSLVPGMAGDRHLPSVKREIEKAKA